MSGSKKLKSKNESEKRTLVIFRTHFLENCIINEYKKIKRALRPNEDCIIFFDNHKRKIILEEKKKEFPIYNFEVESENIKFLLFEERHLYNLHLPMFSRDDVIDICSKVMYYNSDYPFYITNHYLPDYDYYWQIEYDVYCNGQSYDSFFEKYRNSNSDLIISQYSHFTAKEGDLDHLKYSWIYNNEERFVSLFPVVRLSNSAIQHLYKKRVEHAQLYKPLISNPDYKWIFCEQFVPAELVKAGFDCEKLEGEFLRFKPNYDLNTLRFFEKPDNKLYHPVKSTECKKPHRQVGNEMLIYGYN